MKMPRGAVNAEAIVSAVGGGRQKPTRRRRVLVMARVSCRLVWIVDGWLKSGIIHGAYRMRLAYKSAHIGGNVARMPIAVSTKVVR